MGLHLHGVKHLMRCAVTQALAGPAIGLDLADREIGHQIAADELALGGSRHRGWRSAWCRW